jgi:YebC/PmpR family DNA-binding regulatory protein
MSGHSKWHTIKHKKGAADAKRGKIFTRIIKELTVAARAGGGDADANPRLRTIVAEAKSVNMPADNIKRAIQRGTGELEGVNFDELTYEGYGPGGAAVMVDVLTDNRNRTVAELRNLFSKNGGSLGEQGCVAWIFDPKGIISVPKEKTDEETVMMAALEAGAEDVRVEEESFDVVTAPEDLPTVRQALEAANIPFTLAETTMLPKNSVELQGKEAQQMVRLMEGLEDHDDVQHVYANFDIPESVIAALA